MVIKLIVGLGNFGQQYIATRHNLGAYYVHLLAKTFCQSLKQENKFFGCTSVISLNNSNVRLLIPSTFMNISGKSILSTANFYHISPEEILIAHDELNLLPGTVRIKYNGSHGGHNGLKNIITCFSNKKNFYRLRIGIGHPGDKTKVVDFVLNKPSSFEEKLINKAVDKAIDCTKILMMHGIVKAVNQLHKYYPM